MFESHVIYLIVLHLALVLLSAVVLIFISRRINRRQNKSVISTVGKLKVIDVSGIPEAEGCKRVALLIDADNINSECMQSIMENIGQICDCVLVFMGLYGLAQNQAGWIRTAQEYDMQQKFLTNYLKRKNSTDFRIVIDCMDLLHDGDVDMFVLCSSDSDFSGIAERIIQEGKIAIGMGKKQTPDVFRHACTRFFLLDGKETSAEKLETVLQNLVDFYKDIASYCKIKSLIEQRFELSEMGYESFEQMLFCHGYDIDEDKRIVRTVFDIGKNEPNTLSG